MPQSTARWEATSPTQIAITHSQQNGYAANPPNVEIRNDGSLKFSASQACWLYTTPTGVFGDAQGILKLVAGNNGPFDPGQQNVTVGYCITDPNTTCTPEPPATTASSTAVTPEGSGNTIKVG
jgi:hypothetical protein